MNSIKKSIKQKKIAKKIIQRRMLYAAGLGLIPIPIIDAASILGTQVLMIRSIANLYGVPFKEQLVKSFIGSLVGSLGTAGVVKAIPGLGSVIGGAAMSLTGAAATYAIGKVFVQHFDQGGTLLDFDPVESRKYFEEVYKEGELEAQRLKIDQTNDFSITHQNSNNKADDEKKRRRAKRLKALRAKQRRKRQINNILAFLFLFIFVGLIIWLYPKRKKVRPYNITDTSLFQEEKKAIEKELKPFGVLDTIEMKAISAFSEISTEGFIAQYLQNRKAIYPKRYTLSAVRFRGVSNALNLEGKKQLTNIALLMKKYPDLIINVYGHTTHIGPEFNRKRIGRERARTLERTFVELGVPAYRVTGNYIEKEESIYNEYWGAEILLDVVRVSNQLNGFSFFQFSKQMIKATDIKIQEIIRDTSK